MVKESAKVALVNLILNNDIFLGIWKQCPHCIAAQEMLDSLHLLPRTYLMNEDDPLLESLRTLARTAFSYSTVPLVFIKGRFIGGNSELQAMKNTISEYMNMPMLDHDLVLTKNGADFALRGAK
ncbi:glutaredoxin 3 [Nematocida sp. AWRm77]|nr:glutaredoxin 3 [Nematocida sp. AWRm77]